MANSLQGVTAPNSFFSCNPAHTPLFSVNPGVPAEDCLEVTSCLIDDAMRAIENDAEMNHAAHSLLAMAKAALDATLSGMLTIQPASPEPGEYRELIANFYRMQRDGVFMIAPGLSDGDGLEALSLLDAARNVACGGAFDNPAGRQS